LKWRKSTREEGGPKVPGYIVTYSDMVTLLLTFFVMLLSLADVQDPELFDKGRDSFIESLRCIGLGMLFGRSNVPNLGDPKLKYPTESPDESDDGRMIDSNIEELRRICEKLREQAMIVPSPVAAERADYSVANVHFSPGGDSLDESARQFLTGFCRDLRQDASRKRVILYVLGLASDGGTEKERVFLSARRAKVVADFLRSNLSLSSQSSLQGRQSSFTEQSRWSVYSWGAGSGGDWANQDSPFSKKSQILIAVLRKTG
jgi:outer membrane protein OmpA-like peptidoglycan-associated protein